MGFFEFCIRRPFVDDESFQPSRSLCTGAVCSAFAAKRHLPDCFGKDPASLRQMRNVKRLPKQVGQLDCEGGFTVDQFKSARHITPVSSPSRSRGHPRSGTERDWLSRA